MITESQLDDIDKGIFDEAPEETEARHSEIVSAAIDAENAKSTPMIGMDDIFENPEAEEYLNKVSGVYEKQMDLDGLIEESKKREDEKVTAMSPFSNFSKYVAGLDDAAGLDEYVYGTGTAEESVVREERGDTQEKSLLQKTMYALGDFSIGTFAGLTYDADAFIDLTNDAINYVSGEPAEDIRFFSTVGDYLMKDKGAAGELGRDLGRFMIPWLAYVRGVKLLTGTIKLNSQFKFTTGLGRASRAKAHAVKSAVKGDFTANSAAYLMTGLTAYKSEEMSGGRHALMSIDNLSHRVLGTPIITEYFKSTADNIGMSDKQQDILANGFGELFFMTTLDKTLVPLFGWGSGRIGEWWAGRGEKSMAQRIAKFVEMEKHALMLEAKENAGASVTARAKNRIVNENGNLVTTKQKQKTVTFEGTPANEVTKSIYESLSSGKFAEQLKNSRTPEEILQFIDDVAEQSFKAGKTDKKTLAQMRKEADGILEELWGVNSAGLLARKSGDPINESIAMAYAVAVKSVDRELSAAVEALSLATDDTLAMATKEFFRSLRNFSGLRTQMADVSQTWGRTGAALKGGFKWEKKGLSDVMESPTFEKLIADAEGASADDVLRMALTLSGAIREHGTKGLAKGVDLVSEHGFTDGFFQVYIGLNLLGNPGLQALNLASGLTNLGSQIGSRFPAGLVSQLTGHGDVKALEGVVGAYGLTTSILTALRMSARAFVTGKSAPAFRGSKFDGWQEVSHLASKDWGVDKNVLGLAFDSMNNATKLTNRGLLSGDEFIKVLSYEVEASMLSFRRAMGEQTGSKFDYNLFKTRFSEMRKDPRSVLVDGKSIHSLALEQGKINTLQADLGRFGKFMQSAQTEVPIASPIVKFMVPFVKVLSNAPKLVIRHSPLSAMNFFGKNSVYGKHGGQYTFGFPNKTAVDISPSQQMEEVGRMAWGTMLMFMGGVLYANDLMTDAGEPDYGIRRQGTETGAEPPLTLYHVSDEGRRFGVDVSRLQPWGNLLGLGASAWNLATTNDELTIADYTEKALWNAKQTLANQSWVPNLHKLIDMVANDQMEPWQYQQAANSIIASMLPAPVRSASRAYENIRPEMAPFRFSAGDESEGKPQDASLIAARLMGASTGQENIFYPKRNWKGDVVTFNDNEKAARAGVTPFGLPKMLTTGMLAFMHVREDKSSLVDKELQKINLALPVPSSIIKMPDTSAPVRMRPNEYDAFRKRMGSIKDAGGKTMEQRMTEEVTRKGWDKLPNKHYNDNVMTKHTVLLRIFNRFKGYAKNSVIKDYALYLRGDHDSVMNFRIGPKERTKGLSSRGDY